MPKNLDCSTTSTPQKRAGPDLFSFYSSEVEQLLSSDEGHLPFSLSTAAPFSNGVGLLLSDSKKERLKSLLRQSAFTLTKEVDELIDPILSICRIQSCLECKVDQPQKSHKRIKHECSNQLENGSVAAAYPQIDDDMKFLLESDTTRVEELVKNQSNEFLNTLHHMGQKFEELLNFSMTSCSFFNREMTPAEKLQLRRSIKSLPPRNLDRVVGIMQSDEKFCKDEVHVDLDNMENATLWRLYFYFATVRGNTT